jgi:beta-glucosidase/6-phospho-beta-glucosidase/beta-galactosidase
VDELANVLGTINAYATEGGLDGRFQPATCFNASIALGHFDGPGPANDLWHSYEEFLATIANAGVAQIRLDLSWARLEPREGHFDHDALTRYRSVIETANSLGIAVHLSACDGAWPAWLGHEPWLWPWTTPVTMRYLEHLHEGLPDVVAMQFFADDTVLDRGYLTSEAPPWRRRAREDLHTVRSRLGSIIEQSREHGWLRGNNENLTVRSLLEGAGPLRSADFLFTPHESTWLRR